MMIAEMKKIVTASSAEGRRLINITDNQFNSTDEIRRIVSTSASYGKPHKMFFRAIDKPFKMLNRKLEIMKKSPLTAKESKALYHDFDQFLMMLTQDLDFTLAAEAVMICAMDMPYSQVAEMLNIKVPTVKRHVQLLKQYNDDLAMIGYGSLVSSVRSALLIIDNEKCFTKAAILNTTRNYIHYKKQKELWLYPLEVKRLYGMMSALGIPKTLYKRADEIFDTVGDPAVTDIAEQYFECVRILTEVYPQKLYMTARYIIEYVDSFCEEEERLHPGRKKDIYLWSSYLYSFQGYREFAEKNGCTIYKLKKIVPEYEQKFLAYFDHSRMTFPPTHHIT